MSARRRSLARRTDLPLGGARRGRPGTRLGRHGGPGTEILASRPYTDGDDVKRVDWNATARTGELHVKGTVADISLPISLVIDTSASMRTGSCRRKIDTAVDAACFVAEIAASRGERCRLLLAGAAPGGVVLPAGRRAVAAIEALVPQPQWGSDAPLGPALGTGTSRYTVLVTDLFGDDGDLAAVAARSGAGLLLVEVTDPVELALPSAGRVRFVDPETGQVVRVDSSGPLGGRYRELLAERRRRRHALVAASGGSVVTVSTDEEVDVALATRLPRRR